MLRNDVTANLLVWYALALCFGLILLAVAVPCWLRRYSSGDRRRRLDVGARM